MCVILICPEQVRPSLEKLRLCQQKNPHGIGIAWRDRGAVGWTKNNNVEVIDQLARRIKGEIIIHFRLASVGGVCDELRHPFPIRRDAGLERFGRHRSVLFHNGTWHGWSKALDYARNDGHSIPKGTMSDTRAAAFLCSIYGTEFLSKCGVSRWVYFSAAKTVRIGRWHEREGIAYSNLRWLPKPVQPLLVDSITA